MLKIFLTNEVHYMQVSQYCTWNNISLIDSFCISVVDIYGTTKQVRIVQLYGISSLQGACREVILGRIPSTSVISSLPLPKKLKDYLSNPWSNLVTKAWLTIVHYITSFAFRMHTECECLLIFWKPVRNVKNLIIQQLLTFC